MPLNILVCPVLGNVFHAGSSVVVLVFTVNKDSWVLIEQYVYLTVTGRLNYPRGVGMEDVGYLVKKPKLLSGVGRKRPIAQRRWMETICHINAEDVATLAHLIRIMGFASTPQALWMDT